MLGFLIKVVLISLSGALAPGPLTAASAAAGVKHGWRGGLLTSIGHIIVELPLVILIGLGVVAVIGATINRVLSITGGLFLILFAFLIARDAIDPRPVETKSSFSPLLSGITLTALNPFFITWWIGIGSPLVAEAIRYWGIAGIGILYVAHVWIDLAWLTGLARLTTRVHRFLLLVLSVIMILFGIDFLYHASKTLYIPPQQRR